MIGGCRPKADAATLADAKKLRAFERPVRVSTSLTDRAATSNLGFNFEPLAVDTLGAPSKQVVAPLSNNTPGKSRCDPQARLACVS